MDLLGSYSSDDDDDDSNSSRSSDSGHHTSKKRGVSPPTPMGKTKPLVTDGSKLMPSPIKKKAPPPAAAKTKTSKKGKKLISLHSVLPPHILEQLTKSEAGGDLDDSSDDDDDDNNNNNKPSKKPAANKKKAQASEDQGIANFLTALNSAKTNNKLLVGTNNQKKKTSTSTSSSSKLGAAFVTVASTTTTRKKKDGTLVETVEEEEPHSPTGNQSPSHYRPLSLSPRTAFHRYGNKAATPTSDTSNQQQPPSVPLMAAPTSVSSVPAPRRSAAPAVAAAPPAVAVHTNYAATNKIAPQSATTYDPPVYPTEDQYDEEPMMAGKGSRSKKRQLQKALRAGNFNEVQPSMAVEQEAPTAYVPEPETYAVPTHGVKVVATQMYNPKAGTVTTTDLAQSKGKGKNQINQLMASAAHYELQQARSGGANAKANNQRAGAKRKYGW